MTMRDRRIIDKDGKPMRFTCENSKYKTNVAKVCKRRESPALGSVFSDPLIEHCGDSGDVECSLWLEYVTEKYPSGPNGSDLYWLMWYDRDGKPTIPLSGVFSKDELKQMISRLADFIP